MHLKDFFIILFYDAQFYYKNKWYLQFRYYVIAMDTYDEFVESGYIPIMEYFDDSDELLLFDLEGCRDEQEQTCLIKKVSSICTFF